MTNLILISNFFQLLNVNGILLYDLYIELPYTILYRIYALVQVIEFELWRENEEKESSLRGGEKK